MLGLMSKSRGAVLIAERLIDVAHACGFRGRGCGYPKDFVRQCGAREETKYR